MAVKGKKAQKQQQKPSPKLVKHQEEEEEQEDDEDVAEQSDEEVAEQHEDEKSTDDEEDEKSSDDEEDEKSSDDEEDEKVEKTEADEDGDMKTTIFVGHLNFELTKKEFEDFFSKVGEIQSTRMMSKRGYGFVTYKSADSVNKALKLDNKELAGRTIHVERVKTKKSDFAEKKKLKRKLNREENENGAKKAKLGDKTVQLKKSFKGRPKTAQHSNPNKNKGKPGKFVRAQ